jgi:hypothetical protein
MIKKTKIPSHVRAELKQVIGGLKIFCKSQSTLAEILDGEDDTKETRAVLEGKDGDEIIWSLGYLNAIADVCKCKPSELA